MPSTVFKDLVLHGSNGSKQSVPPFLYSTIYLGDKTGDLVYQALCSGFRGIDTAAYSAHYREDLVGEGLRRALGDDKVKREELFVGDEIIFKNLVRGCKLSQSWLKSTPFGL